jgi:TRAP-type C4-dicarboxylate transport system permease small subunit
MREKSHLGMEILAKRLGYRRQFLVEMVCSAIVLAFLAALVIEGLKLTRMNTERTFGDSTLSYSWVTAAVPVGCMLLGIALIYNMVGAWRGRDRGLLVYTRTAADGAAPEPIDL